MNNLITQWFAISVPYNRIVKLIPDLEKQGIEYFRPMQIVEVFKEGGKSYEEQPIIPSLLFVHCSESELLTVKQSSFDGFYIYCEPHTIHPQAIPDKSMENFIKVVSLKMAGMTLLDTTIDYMVGDKVRVVEGVFKGAEGYIKRIKGRKRLIVSIQGVIAVATTYIPQAFLVKI